MTLTDRLSGTSTAGADAAFDVFIDWAGERGFALYAAQEEAVLALAGGAHVMLATPTGSGKSLVAVAAHAAGPRRGPAQLVYTAPIKALVSEKFFALVRDLRRRRRRHAHRRRGGQRRTPRSSAAPPRCSPTSRCARAAGADVGLVVMDEFHFYAEPDRGWAWQVPLLRAARTPSSC